MADLVHAESKDTKSVPHQVFMNSLFGRRVMHILVNESEDLGLKGKLRFDAILQLMHSSTSCTGMDSSLSG